MTLDKHNKYYYHHLYSKIQGSWKTLPEFDFIV